MNIVFNEKYAENPETFGVNFQAVVDGEPVVCVVTLEALNDIDPPGRFDGAVSKYQNNRVKLENVARSKILKGCVKDAKVYINQSDVV